MYTYHTQYVHCTTQGYKNYAAGAAPNHKRCMSHMYMPSVVGRISNMTYTLSQEVAFAVILDALWLLL